MQARQAIASLDWILEFFGKKGERWTPTHFEDSDGRRCILSALNEKGDESAEHYLYRALIRHPLFDSWPYSLPANQQGWRCGLMWFSARCDGGFKDIRALILAARALAQADLATETERPAA